MIVADFFDTGQSRTLAWPRRPQTAAPVAQLADPDRGWDAIVIGEYERAFYGNQYASMAPLFEHYGVGLWMPEVGGRVDWHAGDHEQTMNTHCALLPSNGDSQFIWLVNHSRGTASLNLDGPGYYWYGSPTGNDEGRGLIGAIVVMGDAPPEARLDRPPQPRP